jgi:hypothetical protein
MIQFQTQVRQGVESKGFFYQFHHFFLNFVIKLLLMVAQVVFGPAKSTQIVFVLSKSIESR